MRLPIANISESNEVLTGAEPLAVDGMNRKSWVWWPSWYQLRTHYLHELGFLACLSQLIGATIFWIAGFTALPGIIDHLSEGLEDGIFWTPQVVGGVGFVISGTLFMLETQSRWFTEAQESLQSLRTLPKTKNTQKRCDHTFTSDDSVGDIVNVPHPQDRNNVETSHGAELADLQSRVRTTPEVQVSTREHNIPRKGHSSAARLIGWLSPEAVLRGQNGSQQTDGVAEQHCLGYWITPDDNGDSSQYTTENNDDASRTTHHNEADAALETYWRAAGVYTAPPKPHQDALIQIYLKHVQPILPILDRVEFE
ncbi:hypothetical protein LTS18_000863 [Coniosporium uncinatum]|uniref:Uncharacterized protein n=1 Tax=Coniosporium uncinatum TaxID=93489 RepID=A0ACC3DYR6_9PEZI|nr:hypothetical protein LTS18_000863 [Coniosporium uncinatum]